MKNFLRIILLAIFGVFLLSSCQEQEKPIDNSTQLIGHWQNRHDIDENMQIIHYYNFFENGKFNGSIVFVDADSNELLGYSRRSTGTYILLNDQLSIQTTMVYAVPESSDSYYVPNGGLVQLSDNYSLEVKVEFREEKMTWIYSPFVGDSIQHIGSQVFERFTPLEW